MHPPPDWTPLLDDFAAAGADPPVAFDDGWAVNLYCALTSAPALLANAPVSFTERARARDPLYDDFGEDVEDETVSGTSASDDGLAILTWVAHWQAGLCATLAVYADRDAYEAALREATELDEPEPTPDTVAESRGCIEP